MKPLDGIRVLDLSRAAPGAYCTMMLSDMGAEVIRVEQPRDATMVLRGSGNSPLPGPDAAKACAYQALVRNKKSVAVNLKQPTGREMFRKLAASADVVLDGFSPGTMDRLGIGYETLSRLNPRIIFCAITGYGQDGPYRDLPGHDGNYIALAGALGLMGQAGGAPILPLNLVGDYAGGGLMAFAGVLLAIVARHTTGRGQYVDIAMTDGALSFLARIASDYLETGEVPVRGKTFYNGIDPEINVYRTKDDRYIALACAEPSFYANLCRALGRDQYLPYQRVEEKREEIVADFRHIFLTKTRDEWFDYLAACDICVAPVNDLDEALSNPQILHRQMVVTLDHPSEGKVRQLGIPIKLSDTPGAVTAFGPVLGQHTDEMLRGLGYPQSAIDEARGAKIIM